MPIYVHGHKTNYKFRYLPNCLLFLLLQGEKQEFSYCTLNMLFLTLNLVIDWSNNFFSQFLPRVYTFQKFYLNIVFSFLSIQYQFCLLGKQFANSRKKQFATDEWEVFHPLSSAAPMKHLQKALKQKPQRSLDRPSCYGVVIKMKQSGLTPIHFMDRLQSIYNAQRNTMTIETLWYIVN